MKLLNSIRAGIGALALAGGLSLASNETIAKTRQKVDSHFTNLQPGETLPGVQDRSSDPWRDLRGEKPTNSTEKVKVRKEMVHAFNALPNGERDVKALQGYLGEKGYYQGNVDGDWGPNSQKALNAYERQRGLEPSRGYSIPKVTYEALVGDMIKHRLELGLKVLNDKPALQAAYAIIFANRYGVSVKGTIGEEIRHIIGTVGVKVGENGVFKVSAAHLEKFENLYFDGVSKPVGTTLTQDAFGAQYTHKSSDPKAILQEIGGGVAFFDAKGKNLGKIADIIEDGYSVGEIQGAWTGGQRFDVFVKGAFRLADNVRLDGTVGYYQSKERNALDYIGQRASGLTISGKVTVDLTEQDRIYALGRWDGDNRWSIGGGYQRAIANGVQAGVEYRYDNPTNGMAANHSIMARVNAQFSWGKDGIVWGDGKNTKTKLPPLFQNSTTPKLQENVEVKVIEESPRNGLTFADLEPVYGVDTERIMVGRAVSQKILKQDSQTKITAPKITNVTATNVTCEGSIEDIDGVKETYFELTGPEGLKRSTSCNFSGLTSGANYQVRIIGKTRDGKTGTWSDVSSSWVNFSTLPANHNPIANPDTASTEYNTPVTVNVIANDTDIDGDTLTILGIPTSSQGTVVVSGDKKSVTFTPNSGFSGNAAVNYIVSDGKGGTANGVLTITVNSQVNHLPVFSSTIPNQTAMVGNVANTVLPVATDVDARDTLTYSITGLPPGLTFAPATRTITGTLTTAGIYNVTYSVTDGKGVTSQNFTITVNVAPDTSPDAFSFTDQTGVALSQLINSNEITVSGINTDTQISVSGGYYSINGGSWTSSVGIVKSGDKVKIQVMSSSIGSTTTSVVLTIGDKSDSFDVTTQAVNHAPTFNATVGNQTQRVGDSINITLPVATDVDAGDTLTYSITGLPTGLSFNASTRVLSGTFTTVGTYNVIYTVSDGKLGGVTNQNFTITVNVAPDTSPDAFSFTDQTGVALGTLIDSDEIIVSGINVDTPISVSGGHYSINGGSWTSSVGKVKNGEKVRVRVMSSSLGLNKTSVVLTIGDKSDSFDVTTQTVNHAPTFNTIVGDQTALVGDSLNITMPVATDTDGDTLTYSTTGLPTGINFNPSTRVLSGTFTVAGNYNVVYTVSDGKGGITNQNFKLTVSANTPPVGTNGFIDMQHLDTEYAGLKSFTFDVTDKETPSNQLTIKFTQVPSNYVNVLVNGILAQTGVSYPITSNFQIETRDGTGISGAIETFTWKAFDTNGGDTGEKTTTVSDIVDD